MKNEKYTRLKEQVQKIEEKILAITGENIEYNMAWTRSQRKCEQVERLIWKRKHLLDKMFIATPEEHLARVTALLNQVAEAMAVATEERKRRLRNMKPRKSTLKL